MRIARENGIRGFQADVMATNSAMLRIFHRAARTAETRLENGIYHLQFELSAIEPQSKRSRAAKRAKRSGA
jgi:hypothetical protein